MRKRQLEAQEAYEAQWDGERSSLGLLWAAQPWVSPLLHGGGVLKHQ